jgi:hypothetical protein
VGLSDNPYIGLPLVDLIDLQQKAIQAIKDILTAGQSYSFPGRTFTRANLKELQDMLGSITQAIGVASPVAGAARQIAYGWHQTQSKW